MGIPAHWPPALSLSCQCRAPLGPPCLSLSRARANANGATKARACVRANVCVRSLQSSGRNLCAPNPRRRSADRSAGRAPKSGLACRRRQVRSSLVQPAPLPHDHASGQRYAPGQGLVFQSHTAALAAEVDTGRGWSERRPLGQRKTKQTQIGRQERSSSDKRAREVERES